MANWQHRRYVDQYTCLNITKILSQRDMKGKEIKTKVFTVTCQDTEYKIKLIKESVNYGGFRYYLSCPFCEKNRKQLYLVKGWFACRTCHKLHYRCQSESQVDRNYRRLDRLLNKVENLGARFDGHLRKKGQHHKTYEPIALDIESTQQAILRHIDAYLQRTKVRFTFSRNTK